MPDMTTDNRVLPGVPAGGQFTAQNRPDGDAIITPALTPGETLLRESRAAIAEAEKLHFTAVKTVVAEIILAEFPTAATVNVAYDEEDGDDAYSYVDSITDSKGEGLWTIDDEGSTLIAANDLLEEVGFGSGFLDLTSYRPVLSYDEGLANKILNASSDEVENLVDGATDNERQGLATHPSVHVRYAVAVSPETDVDTLSILINDVEADVASGAKFSLYSGDEG